MATKKPTICGTLEEGDRQISVDEFLYKNSVVGAVSSMVGDKTKAHILDARDVLSKAKKAKNFTKIAKWKKRLKMEEQKYEDHAKLYDALVKQMMTAGGLETVAYDRFIADPEIMIGSWRKVFQKYLYPHINPMTIHQGRRTALSMLKLVEKVEKKRAKFIKDSSIKTQRGIAAIQMAWLSPETIAMRSDGFGIVHGVMKKILRLTDREINLHAGYTNRFNDIRQMYELNLNQLFALGANEKTKKGSDFTIDKASMWGIRGFNIVIEPRWRHWTGKQNKEREKYAGMEVIIFGEGIHEAEKKWKAKVVNEKGEVGKLEWIPKEDIKGSDEDVKKGLINLYLNEFHNEVSRGQTRDIIPQEFNPVGTDETTVADFIGVEDIRKEMSVDYEYGKANDTKRKTANVHTTRVGAWEYTWIMVKPFETRKITKSGYLKGKNVVGEEYHSFLLKKAKVGKAGEVQGEPVLYLTMEDTKENRSTYKEDMERIFPNGQGWYRSTEEHNFGRRLIKGAIEIEGSANKAWVDFQYMENQPSNTAINMVMGKSDDKSKVKTAKFGEYLLTTRQIFNEVSRDVEKRIRNQVDVSIKIRRKIINDFVKMGKTKDEAVKWIDDFMTAGGIRTRIWESSKGEFRTNNMFFLPKSENYFPDMYDDNNIENLMDSTISRIQIYIDELTSTADFATNEDKQETFKRYKEAELHMIAMRESHSSQEMNAEEVNRLVESERLVHVKHLSNWTKGEQRRKDGTVPYDYLRRMYGIIARNDLVNDALESVYKMSKLEGSVAEGSIDYTLNRVKMAFGDAETRARGPLGGETGYKVMANRLNSAVPKSIRGDMKWDAQSAERLVKGLTTFMSSRFLGATSALGNRTQIVNMIIKNGYRNFSDANELYEKDNDFWKDIIAHTGVLNLMSMFTDVMMQDGKPRPMDWGFLFGGLAAPLPSKQFVQTMSLMLKGRDGFVNNKEKKFDLLLLKLQMRMDGKQKEDIMRLRSLDDKRRNPYTKQETENILRKKRGDVYDLLMMERTEQKEALIKARYKKLIGDITESQLKKFVSWKLSFWIEGAGEKIFTFTEGEQELRKKTVVMALLDAQARGVLPGNYFSSKDISNPNTYASEASIFKSGLALQIARDAVYNTQFGMTPVYMGEALNGLGRLIFQFKQYPIQQAAHDYKVYNNFKRGNRHWAESVPRLTMATLEALSRATSHTSYDPKAELDHEALSVVRLIFTRVLASAIASFASAIIPLGYMMRKLGSNSGFGMFQHSMLRSAENPAVAVAFRILAWGGMFAMAGDDNEEERFGEMFDSIQYLFIPALLSSWIRDGRDLTSVLSDY